MSADGRMHRGHHRSWKGWEPDPRWGTYGTATLDLAAAKLRARGWSEEKIARTIYTPFIVEGPATWSDTWGAPRWAGGYHPHHGQDVLCRYGAPVLAVDKGFLRYGDGPLGGLTVSLIRDDGSFWYYAHLKSYVPGLVDGSEVGIGTVIGFCGASGDASVPHVHFSYYTADGEAVDPMKALVGWLDMADARLTGHARHPWKAPRPSILGKGWTLESIDAVLDRSTATASDAPRRGPADGCVRDRRCDHHPRFDAAAADPASPLGPTGSAAGASFARPAAIGVPRLRRVDDARRAPQDGGSSEVASSRTSSSVTANAPDSTASTMAFARVSSSARTHR